MQTARGEHGQDGAGRGQAPREAGDVAGQLKGWRPIWNYWNCRKMLRPDPVAGEVGRVPATYPCQELTTRGGGGGAGRFSGNRPNWATGFIIIHEFTCVYIRLSPYNTDVAASTVSLYSTAFAVQMLLKKPADWYQYGSTVADR